MNSNGIMLIEFESGTLDVYCENGWLLIQRRAGYDTNFNRTWLEYKKGFGSLRGDFWLGNDIIYKITNNKSYKLRVELTDWSDMLYVAEYDQFRVDNEANFYRLTLTNYKGNASKDYLDDLYNGFQAHNSAYFSTFDNFVVNSYQQAETNLRNIAKGDRTNCAVRSGGGWWFSNKNTCLPVNLNAVYIAGASAPANRGIKWLAVNNYDRNYSLKRSKIMIRPAASDD